MAQIIWTMSAADDLEEVGQVIALDKPDAAGAYVSKILDSIERLAEFPFMGRLVPEAAGAGYRELIVPPCRIIYTPSSESVVIQRIIRSERQLRRTMLP